MFADMVLLQKSGELSSSFLIWKEEGDEGKALGWGKT